MFKLFKQIINYNQLFSDRLLNLTVRLKPTKKSKMESTIFRDWVFNPNYRNYQRKNNETEITIMSYNILAQYLIEKHPNLYYRHNSNDLLYSTRSKNLFHEMKLVRPDILCIQEMQANHLMDFKMKCYSINLHDVIFKKRTNSDQSDGCAIFYNSHLLELIQDEKVEYFQPNVNLLNRSNVAIVAKFRMRNNPNLNFVVATTHLLYNPRRSDVRLAQLQVLLTEIDRVALRGFNESGEPQYEPIILTGDFNFQPYTAHYALIINGYLQYKNLTKALENNLKPYGQKFGNQLLPLELGITDMCHYYDRTKITLHNTENQQNRDSPPVDELRNSHLLFETGTIAHNLNLCSAYDYNNSVSTFQNKWVLVDYIFYRKEKHPMTNQLVESNLKLIARFELPSFPYCFYNLPHGGIPNMWQGSDHFSLAAKFLLSPFTTSK